MAHALSLACLLVLLFGSVPEPAWADYILGPTEVNKSLKTMTRLLKESEETKNRSGRASALARLAKEANYLASLINLEIRSHGFEQKPLIDLAVGRCEELGIRIAYDSGKERYFYDQAAYAEYLRVHPAGRYRQEAQVMVFERTFYAQKSDDRVGIAELSRSIEQFLLRYPKEPRRAELELFVVVLCRDMWRLKLAEPGGGTEEKDKAMRLSQALIAAYPGTSEARLAQAILDSLKRLQPD